MCVRRPLIPHSSPKPPIHPGKTLLLPKPPVHRAELLLLLNARANPEPPPCCASPSSAPRPAPRRGGRPPRPVQRPDAAVVRVPVRQPPLPWRPSVPGSGNRRRRPAPTTRRSRFWGGPSASPSPASTPRLGLADFVDVRACPCAW
ncbi:hypothetical protein ACP70R_012696 [Stipagrostis hirtigluma subsp. patula]